jgi:hypothetical protein
MSRGKHVSYFMKVKLYFAAMAIVSSVVFCGCLSDGYGPTSRDYYPPKNPPFYHPEWYSNMDKMYFIALDDESSGQDLVCRNLELEEMMILAQWTP